MFYLVFTVSIGITSVQAQDVRASNYEAIPLLINPGQTGNFSGKARINGYQGFINSADGNNTFSNLSADIHLDSISNWALGLNYFHSGNDDFQVKTAFDWEL